MPPAIINNKPSLELRINSLDDARAVINQSGKIIKKMTELKLDNVEFLIAEDIRVEANELIRGVFVRKSFTSYVAPRPGNTFMPLDHFKINLKVQSQRQPDGVAVPIKAPSLAAPKRGGRPKGSKNKSKKVNNDNHTATG